MPWNPDQYLKFQNERFLPFDDLVALIRRRPGLRVVDLGCGSGELTARLADLLPQSQVVGLDSSPEMLARAQPRARAGLAFALGDLAQAAGQWDLVFSHAAIHWVDDHVTLIPKLLRLVAPGGQLAVQVPSNHHHLTHQAILELAAEEPFRTALGGWSRPSPVLGIDSYADLLHAAGGRDLTVIEKVYPHVLPDSDAVAEWTRGTTMVPYLERLPEPLRADFLDRYRARLRAHWPHEPVFYGFRRILLTATAAD